MTRWRFTVWFPDKPSVRVRKQWQGACKLCAIARCMEVARTCEIAHRAESGTCKWTVEALLGGMQGWDIRFTDQSRIGDWVTRHGH